MNFNTITSQFDLYLRFHDWNPSTVPGKGSVQKYTKGDDSVTLQHIENLPDAVPNLQKALRTMAALENINSNEMLERLRSFNKAEAEQKAQEAALAKAEEEAEARRQAEAEEAAAEETRRQIEAELRKEIEEDFQKQLDKERAAKEKAEKKAKDTEAKLAAAEKAQSQEPKDTEKPSKEAEPKK